MEYLYRADQIGYTPEMQKKKEILESVFRKQDQKTLMDYE